MKAVSSAPGDYIHFKSQVPLHKISIGMKQWRYYDFGPKVVPPLICLPGIAGTADVYYKQIMSLSMKGYRVISVDIPCAWNHVEWIQAFEKFLDTIDVHHVHLYGTSLGGFLAQLFAQRRPRRVKSLVLSNSFLETCSFKAAMPWAPIVSWSPSFLLKRYILTGIRDGPHEPFIADSVDFVVCQVEALSRDDLASRLSLNVDAASVGSLLLSDSFITIMDTNDYCAVPQQLKDQLSERYPGARRAYLKTGGDFPFLSRPDEVNLHLQLHLRRVGVEAQLDLVLGSPSYGGAGSPSKDQDGGDGNGGKNDDGHSKDDPGNAPKDKDGGEDDGRSKDGAGDDRSEGPSKGQDGGDGNGGKNDDGHSKDDPGNAPKDRDGGDDDGRSKDGAGDDRSEGPSKDQDGGDGNGGKNDDGRSKDGAGDDRSEGPSKDQDGGDGNGGKNDDGHSKDNPGNAPKDKDGGDDDGRSKDGAGDDRSEGPSSNKGGDIDDPSKDDSGPSTNAGEDNSTAAPDGESYNLDAEISSVLGISFTLPHVVGHTVLVNYSSIFVATETILQVLLLYIGQLVLYTSRKSLLMPQD